MDRSTPIMKVILNTLTLIACCLCSQLALSDSVSNEQEELAALKQQFAQAQNDLQRLQQESKSLPDDLQEAQAALTSAEAELSQEQVALTQAKIAHNANPSKSTERQVRLAEIKAGLSETRVRTATRNSTKLQESQANMQQTLATASSKVNSLQAAIRSQEQRLANAIVEAEVERRRQQERAQRPEPVIKPEAPKVAIQAPVIPPPVVEETPEPEPVASQPQLQPTASTVITLSEQEYQEYVFAKQKITAARQLAEEAPANDNPAYRDLLLKGNNIDNQVFTYLGNQQYRTDVALETGAHNFRIEGVRFRVEAPESETPIEYVFLVDATDRERFKVSYFRKSMLAYVGQQVAKAKPAPTVEQAPEKIVVNGVTLTEPQYDEYLFAKEKYLESELLASDAPTDDQANFSELMLDGPDNLQFNFTYLGNQQYRADASLPSGRHRMKVDGLRFRVDVPRSDKPLDYIFLVDARDKDRLRASYFRKEWLSLVDQVAKNQ